MDLNVWLHICKYLPGRHVVLISRVCKDWLRLLRNPECIKYLSRFLHQPFIGYKPWSNHINQQYGLLVRAVHKPVNAKAVLGLLRQFEYICPYLTQARLKAILAPLITKVTTESFTADITSGRLFLLLTVFLKTLLAANITIDWSKLTVNYLENHNIPLLLYFANLYTSWSREFCPTPNILLNLDYEALFISSFCEVIRLMVQLGCDVNVKYPTVNTTRPVRSIQAILGLVEDAFTYGYFLLSIHLSIQAHDNKEFYQELVAISKNKANNKAN